MNKKSQQRSSKKEKENLPEELRKNREKTNKTKTHLSNLTRGTKTNELPTAQKRKH